MPWTAADAPSHTAKADTPEKKKAWAKVANQALEDGDSEASAVKQANAAVAGMHGEPGAEQREPTTGLLHRFQVMEGPQSYNPATREADAIISVGSKVRRRDFWTSEEWDEELRVEPGAVRMDRLNAGAQLLDSHAYFAGFSAVLGAVVPGTARIEGGQLLGRIRFNDSPTAQLVASSLQRGIPVHLSAGYKTHREIRDTTTSPETRVAVDWEPLEVSVVPVAAEGGAAGFRSAIPSVEAFGHAMEQMNRALPALRSQNMAEKTEATGSPNPGVDQDTAARAADIVRQREDERRASEAEAERQRQEAERSRQQLADAERTRAADIMAICRKGGLSMELAENAIKDGMTVDAFRAKAFDELANRSTNTASAGANGGNAAQVTVGRDEGEGRAEAMTEAIVTRILGSRRQPAILSTEHRDWARLVGRVDRDGYDMVSRSIAVCNGVLRPQNERASQYMGMGLSEMAAECIGYRGNIRTVSQATSILEEAFGVKSVGYAQRAMHSTSDFPAVFLNALNKSLLGRYQLAMPTFRQIAAERNFVDFRPHPQIRTGDFPKLQPITETGEIRYGTTLDSKETVSVSPYGIIFAISRQMIVNDEMGAIDQILGSAGDQVLIFENTTFYDLLKTNPTLNQDSAAVFAEAHKNYFSPGSPPGINSVSAARAAFRAQTNLSGNYMNIAPAILLTGPLSETAADQLVAGITPAQSSNVNPFTGRLRIVTDANITDHSWYLFAEPGQLPNFVYGFLNGAQGPRVRTDEPFGVQSVRMSLEHDFGVGAIDFRGAVFNGGAGTIVSGG